MSKKLTTAEFIERARNVHGDEYDYSKVEYVTQAIKIKIICPEHGEFEQSPSNHLSGHRCPDCALLSRAKKRTKTTEQFVKEAHQVHGDKYNYSHVKYTGQYDAVKIICPEHGEFNQDPKVHLMGSGCPECGLKIISKKKRLTQKEFIERAIKTHKGKYDYSKVDYQLINKKIKIICPEHGMFRQLASDHLYNGSGCPACVGLERYGADEFIKRANEAHDNKYDYSKVKYVNANSKVTITCPKHGDFKQKPSHHTTGIGCPDCKADILREYKVKSTDEFIADAQNVHGDKYDYSSVEYVDGKTEIDIICPEHGAFTQLPRTHLQTSGCPLCAESGIKLNESGILYYLRVETRNQTFWKIGVTNRTVEKRFSGEMDKITIVKTWSYKQLEKGYRREQDVLRQYSKFRSDGIEQPLKKGGNTELFTRDVLGLDRNLV